MSEPTDYPLTLAFELAQMGVELRAQRHRREHPEATEAEVDAVVAMWLQHRPGAQHGDAPGRVITLPRQA